MFKMGIILLHKVVKIELDSVHQHLAQYWEHELSLNSKYNGLELNAIQSYCC